VTYLLRSYHKQEVSWLLSVSISVCGAGGGIVLLQRTPVHLSLGRRDCRFITRAETRLGRPTTGGNEMNPTYHWI
jgi:hypothetical protein